MSRIRGSLIITPQIIPGGATRASNVMRLMEKPQPAHTFLHVNSA